MAGYDPVGGSLMVDNPVEVMSLGQQALRVLREKGDMTTKFLRRELKAPYSLVNKIVDSLIYKGLVTVHIKQGENFGKELFLHLGSLPPVSDPRLLELRGLISERKSVLRLKKFKDRFDTEAYDQRVGELGNVQRMIDKLFGEQEVKR